MPLEKFLLKQKATHFLVIKNDSIVFEYKDKKISSYEPSPSFSIAKIFVSGAIGVALKEGYIKSVNELVKNYLPELNYHKHFETLTINHLLNQTSGLKSTVSNISDANYGKVEKITANNRFDDMAADVLCRNICALRGSTKCCYPPQYLNTFF